MEHKELTHRIIGAAREVYNSREFTTTKIMAISAILRITVKTGGR